MTSFKDEELYEELAKRMEGTCTMRLSNMLNPFRVSKYSWTDEVFMTKWVTTLPSYIQPSDSTRAKYAKKFLNYLATGEYESNDKLNFMRRFLLCWKLDGAFVAQEPLLYDAQAAKGHSPEIEEFPEEQDSEYVISAKFDQGGGNYQAWYSELWKYLTPSMRSADHENFERAINYLIFYDLALFRLVTKDPSQVERYISRSLDSECKKFFGSFLNLRNRCPAPHSRIWDALNMPLRTRNENGPRSIVITLVHSMLWSNEISRRRVEDIMKAACMDVLSMTGLAPLQWLVQAAKSLETKPETLLRVMETISSLARDVKEMSRMMRSVEEKNERTWKYARIIDDGVMTELSVPDAPLLSLTLVFVEQRDPASRDNAMKWPSLKAAKSRRSWAESIADSLISHFDELKKDGTS